jgi:hypothetical protein
MNKLSLLRSHHMPSITLDMALDHLLGKEWSQAAVAKSRYSNGSLGKDIRDAEVANLDEDFYRVLNEEVGPIIDSYAKENNILISKAEGYHIVKYSKGQFFKEHTDSTEEFPRKISAVLYLNDDYEGGTITFSKLNTSFKPESQTLFVFPSTEDFMHSADPVIDGTKYVVVGFWS